MEGTPTCAEILGGDDASGDLCMSLTYRQAESVAITEALRAASGRVGGPGGAAERLGLKRTTLQNKMRRLGITRESYV